jgi:hypothetical protein
MQNLNETLRPRTRAVENEGIDEERVLQIGVRNDEPEGASASLISPCALSVNAEEAKGTAP